MEYFVLSAVSVQHLEVAVNRHLRLGAVCQGGVTVLPGAHQPPTYFQAMTIDHRSGSGRVTTRNTSSFQRVE